ncbi:MAG TPA: redox-regulated ATPase YchF [Anaerolineae bacterium]|nr:redox-regulated ATPase YchF [Anaerolineae bacterium]
MQIGILGLPQSGKTTIFHALAGGEKAMAAFSSGQLKIQTTVTSVPDARVDRLSAMFNPRKTIYAKVTYADVGGMDKGVGKTGLPGPFVNQIGQMDALMHVLRVFENPSVPHSEGALDPLRDLAILDTEFLLNDLGTVERRLERIDESLKKGAPNREQAAKEKILFERLKDALESEQPLRGLGLSAEEEQGLRGYGFLTLKPTLIVLNLDENGRAPDVPINQPHTAIVALNGQLEREIVELAPEDAALFMQEYGIGELSRTKVIGLSYELLGVQSFFTVGEDEVRAWTVRRGATAVEAAAAIHTDLAQGFIRAEVVAYSDLIELGGMNEAKAKGKFRLEGKEYLVKDGDIVHIRHSG